MSHNLPHTKKYLLELSEDDQKKLAEKGIATGLHYPVPLHLQNAYKHLGFKEGDFPITEECAKQILSLPMYPELTDEQVAAIEKIPVEQVAEIKTQMQSAVMAFEAKKVIRENPIRETPISEYPRPQLKRKEWLNLNGLWAYAIKPKKEETVIIQVDKRNGEPQTGYGRS
jgi:hypothetical protein